MTKPAPEKRRPRGRPIEKPIKPLPVPADEIAKRLLRPVRKPTEK